MHAQ
ncbi:Protein CBG27146 [Caenorhabditis briggsae]